MFLTIATETLEIGPDGQTKYIIPSGQAAFVQHSFVIGTDAYYVYNNGKAFKLNLVEKTPLTRIGNLKL
jgi:hypothetical protein